jgi:diguanylate cyclase (GGDEF)-like protein
MFSLLCWIATSGFKARAHASLALLLILIGGGSREVLGATPMRFERLGLDDGLSQQRVLAIAQDKQGFMWFGTEDGLDRFNGYSFQHLRQTRDASGLPDAFITDLRIDPAGRLWVATDGGAVLWRAPGEQHFHSILTGVADSTAKGLDCVRVIRFDRTGQLWIGSREAGLARLDPRTGQLARYRHQATQPASLSDDSIFALLVDRHGVLWVGTHTGLDRLDPATGTFQHVPLEPGRRTAVFALAEDRDGLLWLGTSAGLIHLDPAIGIRSRFHHDAAKARSLPAEQVLALHLDAGGRLWIGTPGGLALLDPKSDAFDVYRNDPADPYSLPDDYVLALEEDRNGLLWIGTRFGGIGRWNPRTWSLGQHPAGAEEGMSSRNVMAFTQDEAGRLWVATFAGGITIVDPRGAQPRTLHRARTAGSPGLSDDKVMALLTDREGVVWAGTMTGGLDRIDPRTLAVTTYSHDPNDPSTLGAPGVMSLLEDSSNRLWIGTYGGGLSRLDRSTGLFRRYLPDAVNPGNPAALSANRVTALAQDRTGRLWVGTDGGGLNVLDPNTGRFFHLEHTANQQRSLGGSTVYSIYVDPRGTVWVGTRSGGLDRVVGSALAPEAIRFDNFNERDGLPNDTVYGIHADTAGRLWLSTNYGLARFDPGTGEFRSFHRSNGLQAEEFNFGAHYADRAGRLFFGGARGYNAFDPATVSFDTSPPSVVLTEVLESGKPVPLTNPLSMPRLHYRDVVSFDFAALDFAAPRANVFAFRLEGFDRDWEHAGTQHRVTYTNLPDGHYTLHVRAGNPDGVWNEAGFELPFDVDPPAWLSRWAYLGYALLFAAVVLLCWVGHRRSLIREARYSERLREEVRMRTRELAARNTELEVVNSRLEQASLTDPLTQLGNRRSLIKDMPRLLAQVDASQATSKPQRLSLMLVDLDRLKPINDEFGHEAGDIALEAVATLLRRSLGTADRVVRWGGDEFVIVRALSDLDDAARLAEEIRLRTAELRLRISESASAHTTCSIGFAFYPFVFEAPGWASWQEVLNLADMALYRAKVRRDAWLGWCGLPRAARQTELFRLMSVDPHTAQRAGYIDVRCSPGKDKHQNDTVEIPTRRVRTV